MATGELTSAQTINIQDFPQIIGDEYNVPWNIYSVPPSYGWITSTITGNNLAQESGQLSINDLRAMSDMYPPVTNEKESKRMGIIRITEEALIEALGIVTGGVDITHIEFHRMDNTIDIVIKADKPRVEFGDGSIIDLPKRVEGSQIPYVTPQQEQGEDE